MPYPPGSTAFSRSVSARLVERFIFNFRLAPEALQKRLPVNWLRPQVINGWSVVSFCILRIKRLMLAPIPAFLGFDTISCAYRCGVIDTSGIIPEPSVYILGRNTDNRVVSRLAPAIFLDTMPRIQAAVKSNQNCVNIRANSIDGRKLFSASIKSSKSIDILHSKVFDSLGDFTDFIRDGVSSYTPSVHRNRYTRIDLHKEDSDYESVDATVDYSLLDFQWQDAGLIFDSAVRAGGGGLYRWTFKGELPQSFATHHDSFLKLETTSGIPST